MNSCALFTQQFRRGHSAQMKSRLDPFVHDREEHVDYLLREYIDLGEHCAHDVTEVDAMTVQAFEVARRTARAAAAGARTGLRNNNGHKELPQSHKSEATRRFREWQCRAADGRHAGGVN